MSRVSARLLAGLASLLLGLSGCEMASDNLTPQTCVSDAECGSPSLACVIGVCVDPSTQALDEVYLEVRPPEGSGHRPQQLLDPVSLAGAGRIEVPLRPTVRARGAVVGAGGGPMAAQVVAVPRQSIPGRALVVSASADATTGEFLLPLVEGEQYNVTVWPQDTSRPPFFFATPLLAMGDAAGDLPLDAVQLASAEDLACVSGRVVAGEGAAQLGMEGLEVRLLSGNRRVSSLARTQASTGAFSVCVADGYAGELLALEVRATEANRLNPTVRVEGVVPGADEVEVRLGALGAPVAFGGVVNGPDGQPVPLANIHVRGQVGEGVFSTLITADEQGRYDTELRPARYDFAVVAPVSNPTGGLLLGFSAEVSQGAPAPMLNVRGRQLASGQVTDADGSPVGNAAVRLTRIGPVGGGEEPLLMGLGWTFTTVSDAEGRWQQPVDPGRYRVVVTPDSSARLPQHTLLVDVDEGSGSLDLSLPDLAVFAGVVTGLGGEPLGSSTVTAYAPLVGEGQSAIELGSALAKGDGSFEVLLPDLER